MKYKEYEKFIEITFEIPDIKNKDKFIETLLKRYPRAVNIQMLNCEIRYEPNRLGAQKQSSNYTIYNSKEKSQIIDNRYIPDDEM